MKISRKFNHTGRKRITHEEVNIELLESTGRPPKIDVTFNFKDSSIDPEAQVFLEAYHRNTLKRFSYGRYGDPKPPKNTSLDGLDMSGVVLFNVKVIEPSEGAGRLIALGESIRAYGDEDELSKESLMSIRVTDLKEVPWSIQIMDEEVPILKLNRAIPNVKERFMNDPLFSALVMPSVMREVLLIAINSIDDGHPVEGTYQYNWINFADSFSEGEFENVDISSQDQIFEWLDDVITGFTSNHQFVKSLVKSLGDLDD